MIRRKGLTLQDAFYIVMIAWMAISIFAIIIDIILVVFNVSKGNYNVTIPIHVGFTLPLTG